MSERSAERGKPLPSKAVVLLSGGLDSATCLAQAKASGYDLYALSFDYGQRHCSELQAAKAVAAQVGVIEHRVIQLGLGEFGGSALTDGELTVPENEAPDNVEQFAPGRGIPVTYVPARNTLFLSYALGLAEVLEADAIFIGVNAVDYSGYPDCRPEFIQAFQQMANLATKAGVEGKTIEIITPLIELSKAEIIRTGSELGVDYSLTVSCYQADERGRACGRCESCMIRKQGFHAAGVEDVTRYV